MPDAKAGGSHSSLEDDEEDGEDGTRTPLEELGEDEAQARPLLSKTEKNRSSSPGYKLLEYIGRHAEEEGGVLQTLYGRLPRKELPRIAWLSCTLFVIIGGFWTLDSLKDTVLERTVGLEYQPRAKLVSVVVILLLVAQYNKLIDTVRKPTLFYTIGAFYTILFTGVAIVLGGRRGMEAGLGGVTSSTVGANGVETDGPRPFRLIGWVSYVAIESYGSLAVALFWAFTNASVDLEEAESSYGLIIAGAQVGAILGSTAVTLPKLFAPLHVWHLYLFGAACPAAMAVMVFGYVRLFGDHMPKGGDPGFGSVSGGSGGGGAADLDSSPRHWERGRVATAASNGNGRSGNDGSGIGRNGGSGGINSGSGGGAVGSAAAAGSAGIWDSAVSGLQLVLKHHYVMLIFGISCLYEVVLTVLDYEFKLLGVMRFRAIGGDAADEKFATLMGHFGQATNSLSLLLSLFGTSFVVRKLGVSRTLRIFPTLMVVAVLLSYFRPSLTMLFLCVSTLKGLSYSLNEPCKEMLYMPTSDAVKFKAKAWIDVFGSRCAKGVGSFITESTRSRGAGLRGASLVGEAAVYRSLATFLISLVLLVISVDVGKHFDALIASGRIVGGGGEKGGTGGGAGGGGGGDEEEDDEIELLRVRKKRGGLLEEGNDWPAGMTPPPAALAPSGRIGEGSSSTKSAKGAKRAGLPPTGRTAAADSADGGGGGGGGGGRAKGTSNKIAMDL